MGIYLLQEAIDKVLLERDYKITHYAVIKPSDDWDTLMRGIVLRISIHQKHMSFLGRQRKQKNKHLKLGSLKTAIDRADYTTRDRLLNIESFAKVSAIERFMARIIQPQAIILNMSMMLRLAFFATFRAEGRPVPLRDTSRGLLDVNKYQQNPILIILRQLSFLHLRNRILYHLVNDSEMPRRIFMKKVIPQSIDSTSFTKDYIKYKSSNDLSIIMNNFENKTVSEL